MLATSFELDSRHHNLICVNVTNPTKYQNKKTKKDIYLFIAARSCPSSFCTLSNKHRKGFEELWTRY